MSQIIIGFSGKAGAGKDSAANVLIEERGAVKHSFAKPLKLMLCSLLGVPLHMWDDPVWKETKLSLGLTPREMAQTLGTEWGRKLVHEDLWCAAAMDSRPRAPLIVFSDVRFDNEAIAINALGGYVFRMVRRGDAGTLTLSYGHESESGVSDHLVHRSIYVNAGDMKSLRREVLWEYDQIAGVV